MIRRDEQVGEYRLGRRLGRGGMSVVYKATHIQTKQPVAIKILNSDLPASIEADRRLEQEARAIARIAHPHVVEVYAWGRTIDDQPFIAMEFLKGDTLAQRIGKGRIPPFGWLLEVLDQILSALERAHELDIIHRDLKPDNILLVERDGVTDFVKVLDFGIAKLVGDQPHSLVYTAQGVVLGTPEYLAPEIVFDHPATRATDIYQLGVILFEGLTGRLPFTSGSAAELAERHCYHTPPSLRGLNRSISPALEAVVMRCLEKTPEARYASAVELREALAPFRSDGDTLPKEMDPSGILPTLPLSTGPLSPEALASLGHMLTNKAQAHWPSRHMPKLLNRSLKTLSETLIALRAAHGRADETRGTIAGYVPGWGTGAIEADEVLRAAQLEHRRLDDEVRRLHAELSAHDERPAVKSGPFDNRLRRLGELLQEEGANFQHILSGDTLHHLASEHREAERRASAHDLRLTLLKQLTSDTLALGDAQAALALAKARRDGAVATRDTAALVEHIRLEMAQAQTDALSAQCCRMLTQCAIDLAVALGT